ncbi:MAG: cyclic nucleotide-binding domain-containing protein [Elusimicrobiota bacterium]|jgi:CRP/FNR family transcriptional regulator|nr:cyclic nucleotide-binding domain-containing protein [Elusimicrobiota bacterium]
MIKQLLRTIFMDRQFKDDIEFFKGVYLFNGLSERHLAQIVTQINKKKYKTGEIIFSKGDQAQVIYIVKHGVVKLQMENNERVINSSDFFGDMALVSGHKRTFDAAVVRDSEIYLLYVVRLRNLMKANGKICFQIMSNIFEEIFSKQNVSEL